MKKENNVPLSVTQQNAWTHSLNSLDNEATILLIINSINVQFQSLSRLLEAHILQNSSSSKQSLNKSDNSNFIMSVQSQLNMGERINTLQMISFQKTNLYLDVLHTQYGNALDKELDKHLDISQLRALLLLKSDWILSLAEMTKVLQEVNQHHINLVKYETTLVKLALMISTIMTSFPDEISFYPISCYSSHGDADTQLQQNNYRLHEASTLLVQVSHTFPFSSKKNKYIIYKTIDLLQREYTNYVPAVKKIKPKQQEPIYSIRTNTTKPLVHYSAKPVSIIKHKKKKT
ncbi:hypothetical protein ACFSTH_08045 [Paenibacillus yanchengensis]